MSQQPIHPALARTGVGVAADGTFNMPTRVQFGRGIISTLPEEIKQFGAKKIMVVTDPGVISTRLVDPII